MEIFQILVVSPDLDGVLHAFEEVSPFFQGSDDHKHLLVVDLIVTLDLTQALGVKRHRVPFHVCALLGQDSSPVGVAFCLHCML